MADEESEVLSAPSYSASAWYWQIGEDDTQYWSSADSAMVSVADLFRLTKIDTIENLDQVLRNANLPSPLIKPSDVQIERDRRLAEGFDYDFGDERGVHRIRTSAGDMIGWNEVITLAQAQLNLKAADPNFEMQPITIATGTAVTQVTPIEWQHVMLAASAFRQPIWSASFILESMDPIPTDYANDSYWP